MISRVTPDQAPRAPTPHADRSSSSSARFVRLGGRSLVVVAEAWLVAEAWSVAVAEAWLVAEASVAGASVAGASVAEAWSVESKRSRRTLQV